jgi:hypothetical protein
MYIHICQIVFKILDAKVDVGVPARKSTCGMQINLGPVSQSTDTKFSNMLVFSHTKKHDFLTRK